MKTFRLILNHWNHDLTNFLKLLNRSLPICRLRGNAIDHVAFQTAYALHKKLIKIGAADTEELQSLKKWISYVFCFRQNATIEIQPTDLTVGKKIFR
ncbi:hypothetical protein D3C87_1529490 [compost metagenome]